MERDFEFEEKRLKPSPRTVFEFGIRSGGAMRENSQDERLEFPADCRLKLMLDSISNTSEILIATTNLNRKIICEYLDGDRVVTFGLGYCFT